MRIDARTPTADDTRALGQAFAELLRPRDAVILTGELGAGRRRSCRALPEGWG